MGLLVVISSPSGGGKDSVINALLKRFADSVRFVTTTSRAPRPGNVEGVDYHFISADEFRNKIENGEFIEYNFYAENYYGTERQRLDQTLAEHKLVLTQIEVNGKRNLDKARIPHLAIFLLPESLDELGNRIRRRGGLTETAITERLRIANAEIQASADYDYKIVNAQGKLEETIDKIAEIISLYLNGDKTVDKK